jgi:hypothetical protein
MRVVIVEGAIAGTFELLNVTVSSGHNSAARLREGMALDE